MSWRSAAAFGAVLSSDLGDSEVDKRVILVIRDAFHDFCAVGNPRIGNFPLDIAQELPAFDRAEVVAAREILSRLPLNIVVKIRISENFH